MRPIYGTNVARLALATSLAAFAAPAVAWQAAPTDRLALADLGDVPEIVVTGQRAAEIRAIDAKRLADGIQDSIAATDVGKLPDQNVAEAVRRLPGISIANDQGEGRYVIIRGGDPNLANVTINGQTAAAPEPEGRQVKLDDIPSSLIGSVTVVKTLTPDRDANAIAGQVDINTLTAFDRKKTFAYARAVYGINDLSDRKPFEGDATFGTRFGADRDFGIVVSGNYSRRPIESENIQGSTNYRTLNGQVVPDDFRLRDYNLVRKRYGAVANMDYRPSEDTQFFLRTLYSVFKDNETRDQFRVALPGLRAVPATPTSVGIFNQSGDLASFTGGRGTRFVRRRIEDDDTLTLQGGGKLGLGGGAKLSVEGTYSKATKKDPLRSEFQFRTGNNLAAGIAGTIDLSDTLFIVDPSGPPGRAYDPSFYSALQVNYDRRRAVEELYQGRADLEIPVGFGDDSVIKVGGKYLKRDKTNDRAFRQLDLNGFTLSVAGVDDALYLSDGRYRFGPRVDYDLAQAYITANPARAVANAAASLANSLVADYDVREEIYAGYAMATVKLGELTIIPGVRVEHTEGTYKGKSITATSTPTQGFDIVGRKQYTDVFPGVNLRYDATDKLVLRAAATTAIGRPNYDDLAPFVSVDAGANTVSRGNPGLKALKSRNGDMSIEYYLPGKGLLSVAGFYKHIDDPIVAFGGIASGTFGGVALTNASVTQPINAGSAEIYGVEVNLQAPLTFLSAPFDGFGVNLNYTRTGGSARGVPGRAGKVGNYLQSRNVASAQLYYEKGPLALRAAYSYRSAYLDTVGATRATDQFTDHNGQLDVRASFAVIKQAVLFVEGTNLTDAPWRRYIGNDRQLVENERYSYTARAGLQLAF